MKKLALFILLLTTTTFFGQVKNDSLSFKLDQYFTALTDMKNFNGNVMISKDGQVLLDKTYNMKGENDSLKVKKESRFIIASVSKVFIKYSILKLVELKKITLNDKLSKFIPDFPNGDKITIEHLMHHQSGLPRELTDYEKYDNLSLTKIVGLAKAEKLQFEPGAQTLYSNVGYFLLHYIIDKTSNKGYLAFIEKEIFQKMKLKNTTEFNAAKSIPNFVYGFQNDNGKVVSTPKTYINRFETGNYFSTISDLYSFSKQAFTGKFLDKKLVLELFGKDSTLIQAGGRPGYRAYFYKNLKTSVDFIFVSNYTDIPIQEMTVDIVNIIDHKPYEIPHVINRQKINITDAVLSRYVGKFALEADISEVFSIQLIDNKLFVVYEGEDKAEISPDTETTFFNKPNSKDGYVFSFNEQTKAYELTVISTGMKLKAKRLK
ncbi:MAG: serine hydrolase domain-containing protein [Flavobacterium sp.]